MVLKYHEDYRLALPVFKVGHVIKAGGGSKGGSGFWVITKVMEGRVKIAETGAITKKTPAVSATNGILNGSDKLVIVGTAGGTASTAGFALVVIKAKKIGEAS